MRSVVSAAVRMLLRVYPEPFRERFGPDLESAVEDRLDTVWARSTLMVPLLAARVLLDVAVSAAHECIRPTFHTGSPAGHPTTRSGRGYFVPSMLQDLRFAFRSLRRRPAFTLVVLFTLALGIGASTAVFTVVDGVLLKPLPFPEPDQLVIAWSYDIDGGQARGWMSQPDIESIRDVGLFDGVEGILQSGVSLTGVDRPERVDAARATGGVLTLLAVAPLLGRDLRHEDNHPDAARVLVVSHSFWMSRLGGDPDVVGSTIELSERTWQIVGVAPAGFDYPTGTQMWLPYRLDVGDGCERGCHVYEGALVRLADGMALEVGQQALDALAANLAAEYPDTNTDKGLYFERVIDFEVGDVRRGLWLVLGAVGLVLLIVCANTANLLLVRASSRAREVAVRTALGASRMRLFAQVLTESLLLAGVGSAPGLTLSLGLLEGLRSLGAEQIPRMSEVAVDGSVLLFLVGVTGSVALLFGLSPALHVSGRRGAEQLLGGSRGGTSTGNRARSLLLAFEVALSILLLAGSGLLLRSLDQLYRVDLGFNGDNVTRFMTSLPSARYADLESIVPFYRQLEDRLAAVPGVESVGSVYGAPLAGGNITGTVLVEGRPEPAPGEETGAAMRPITPGYFETMGITLLRGRGIEATDQSDTEPVAVVNEEFVRVNFTNEEVLGAKVRVTASFGFGNDYRRVVGVVRNVRRSMAGQYGAEVYPPHTQFGPGFLQVHVRARPEVGSLVPAIRTEVAKLDANLVLRSFETVTEAKRRDTAGTRFFLSLVTMFAGVAIVLAGVGLYGVVAFLVSQRTREIGIRIALGAKRASVTKMVLQQGLRPTVAGVILGVTIAAFGGRVMEGLLFGVEPADPIVLSSASVLVLLVATAATLIPARRATRVDPTVALRVE